MLIPVIYILFSLLRLQAATLAVTQAARDAGRALDAAPAVVDGIDRAKQIAAIDIADQNIPHQQITLRFITPGTTCSAISAVTPTLDSGAVYDICVTAVIILPEVSARITTDGHCVTLTRNRTPGTFGALVGHPTLRRTATSTAQTTHRDQ